MNPESSHPNSIPTLLRELRDETTTLLRQEVALAKSEMKENVSRVGGHATQIAIGGFVAYAGIIVLLIGIGHLLGALLVRAGLDPQVAEWLAPSIVGLVVALIGWMMLSRAKHALAHDDLAPKQTIESLRENKEWAQNKLHPSS
jgi:hypothetical protein